MNISDRDLDAARPGDGDRGPSLDTDPPFAAGGEGGRQRSAGDAAGLPEADEIVDELIPEEVDWERLVRSYPLPALLLAAGAGFYLGLSRGPVVVSAVTGWAAGEMTRRVNDLVGDDIL